MKRELIKLPYRPDELQPVIGKNTVDCHHGKHLQAYVNNLNNLVAGTPFEEADLETIVRASDGALFNNAGQVLNHELYFTQFAPGGAPLQEGKLRDALVATFGTFDDFRARFEAEGVALFGSGWVWLAADAAGRLSIVKEPNAGNPVTKQLRPLLGFDVWEHAYYLDYQNRRADHLKALWAIVDWKAVQARY
ncbi:MAG: superoxide dismutase [Odoribacteraceae bacterium]|jgi:Fe-Mn family superoxide dismutase|nr:superoxide dismutase [Odoribacteraceae bacterium]